MARLTLDIIPFEVGAGPLVMVLFDPLSGREAI